MNRKTWTLLFGLLFAASGGLAQVAPSQTQIKKKSAKHEQRFDTIKMLEDEAEGVGKAYLNGKNVLKDKLGLQVGLDISYTGQSVAPGGQQWSIQGIYYPYLTWNLFKDTALGSGTLNFNYNMVRYWNQQAFIPQGRAKLVTAFNDYNSYQNLFSQLSYTHTLPGAADWMSVTFGQFPMYNFDGTNFVDNQQTALMNFSLAQNASSTYPLASMGGYIQAAPGDWTFVAGYQDATNVSGKKIEFDTAFDGKYTTFGSVTWAPTVPGLGEGQYSVLVYHQPSVNQQPGYSNGWSLNASQNVGKKWTVFGRANGSDNGIAAIKNSYVLGLSYANPLNRNSLDAITLGVAYNRFSSESLGYPINYLNGESVVELQWVWGIGQFVTITPDLQLYPQAGAKSEQGMSTVVGLRTTIML